MKLDPHQHAPVEFLSKRRRALLQSPAASGKTVIAAAAIAKVLESKFRLKRVKIGWMANTKEQCDQARAAVVMFPVIKQKADVRVHCAAANQDYSDCDLLVVDETHHGVAPEWARQIETCQGARWGMTATPDFEGEDAEWKAARLIELFGPERFVVERADIAHRITKARVVMLDPKWTDGLAELIDAETEKLYHKRLRGWGGDPQKLRAMVWWQKCVEHGIVDNFERTATAIMVANSHCHRGDTVLMLVNQVEHAKYVASRVHNGPAIACYSGMGAKARRHTLYDFKHGKLPCIVATSLADEGLDVPRANVLVLVSGGRSKAKAEQRTGRVLRAFAGKEQGLIYDFADTPHKLMAKHAQARLAVYRGLGYEIVEEGKLL